MAIRRGRIKGRARLGERKRCVTAYPRLLHLRRDRSDGSVGVVPVARDEVSGPGDGLRRRPSAGLMVPPGLRAAPRVVPCRFRLDAVVPDDAHAPPRDEPRASGPIGRSRSHPPGEATAKRPLIETPGARPRQSPRSHGVGRPLAPRQRAPVGGRELPFSDHHPSLSISVVAPRRPWKGADAVRLIVRPPDVFRPCAPGRVPVRGREGRR
jgi:hypothetical protein